MHFIAHSFRWPSTSLGRSSKWFWRCLFWYFPSSVSFLFCLLHYISFFFSLFNPSVRSFTHSSHTHTTKRHGCSCETSIRSLRILHRSTQLQPYRLGFLSFRHLFSQGNSYSFLLLLLISNSSFSKYIFYHFTFLSSMSQQLLIPFNLFFIYVLEIIHHIVHSTILNYAIYQYFGDIFEKMGKKKGFFFFYVN
jgi:hypothetical protein